MPSEHQGNEILCHMIAFSLLLTYSSCLPSLYLGRRPLTMWLLVLALAVTQSCFMSSISFSLPILYKLFVPTWVIIRSFFWHLNFLTCLVISLILAPHRHKTFLLLWVLFLPFFVPAFPRLLQESHNCVTNKICLFPCGDLRVQVFECHKPVGHWYTNFCGCPALLV